MIAKFAEAKSYSSRVRYQNRVPSIVQARSVLKIRNNVKMIYNSTITT